MNGIGWQIVGGILGNQWLYFIYNESGTIIGFTAYTSGYTYNYYYEFNAQGDVVALINSSGGIEATYKYDAWGKLLGVYDANGNEITSSAHIGMINPIRYRGYFYDEETGFYYVSSRYYDPEIGRFICADRYASTGQGLLGTNMYAYCLNNPILYMDLYGSTCSETPLTGWTGFLTSEDYAINEIHSKTDANHDGKFTMGDVDKILDKYGFRWEGRTEVLKRYYYLFGQPRAEGKAGVVTDVSITVKAPTTPVYVKFGVSELYVPESNVKGTYFHIGGGFATPSDSPITVTCSAGRTQGIVNNYDYAESFLCVGYGGFECSGWFSGVFATNFSISNSTTPSACIGYDYYFYIN